jgi:hypothetical protein
MYPCVSETYDSLDQLLANPANISHEEHTITDGRVRAAQREAAQILLGVSSGEYRENEYLVDDYEDSDTDFYNERDEY